MLCRIIDEETEIVVGVGTEPVTSRGGSLRLERVLLLGSSRPIRGLGPLTLEAADERFEGCWVVNYDSALAQDGSVLVVVEGVELLCRVGG